MFKTFINHWKHNFVLGAKRSWEWMGVGGKIVDIIIAVGVGFIIGQTNIWIIGLITIIVAFSLYGFLSLVWAVFIVPFQESEKYKREINKLQARDWSSVIDISPEVRVLKEGNKLTHGITIVNKGSDDLLDCFADLEEVVWAPQGENGKWFAGSRTGFHGRLSWMESSMQSQDCKRRIENNNAGTSIRVIEEGENYELILRLCDPELTSRQSTPGELRLLIRIGGTYNGMSANPIFVACRIQFQPIPKNAEVIIRGGLAVQKLQNREDFDEYTKKWDYIHMEHDEQNNKRMKKKKSSLKMTSRKP